MSIHFNVFLIVAVGTVILGNSCSNGEDVQQNFPSQKDVNRGMEDINRQFAVDERTMIDAYIERNNLQVQSTGTGLRYFIYHQGAGQKAVMGQKAAVGYKVSLLDGTLLYTSDDDGIKEFVIGQDNVETGLHEGLTYLHVGDKAIFILPSHLAHGLSGDNNKIPPRSSVVYDIELIELK